MKQQYKCYSSAITTNKVGNSPAKTKFMRKLLLPLLVAFAFVAGMPYFGFSQQVIGTFPVMDGGFENQTAGALGTTLSSTLWTRQSQSGASSSIVTTSPRSGSKYASVTNVTTVSRGLQSPQDATAAKGPAASTAYIVQFFVRNTSSVASFQVSVNTNGTTNTAYSTAATLNANASWTKQTFAVTSATSIPTTAGILILGRSAAGSFDVDDAVVYAGSTADVSAPSSPTGVTVAPNATTPATKLDVSWTAASGGVDGGGYVVVRYASSAPVSGDDPNQNGIYAVGNTITVTKTGTVAYIGTGTSFTDASLTTGTTYYYKVYSVDKAFNYSSAQAVGGTSGTPAAAATPTKLSISTIANQQTNTGFSVIVTTQDASSNPTNVSSNTTVTLTSNGNAGAIGGTTTGTINAGSNSVTIIGVTLPSVGTGVTITATASGLTSVTSGTFNVYSGCTTPDIVTSVSASNGNTQSVLAWTNGSCFDEMLVVAKATAFTAATPTGDGAAYTANASFTGGGTAFDGGVVVYKGTGTGVTVTSLTNGTTYNFKVFTRKGTNWSSAVSTTATPVLPGYYWNGGNPGGTTANGGTGTWGTSSAWVQPTNPGAAATWADGNNAFFAGTAGTVTIDASRTATTNYFNTDGYTLTTTGGASTIILSGNLVLANNVGLTLAPITAAPLSINSVPASTGANITLSATAATGAANRINLVGTTPTVGVNTNILGSGVGYTGYVSTTTGATITGNITNNSSAAILELGATSGNTLSVSGNISGSSTGGLVFAAGTSGGAGTITLSGTNSYSGPTIFNSASSGIIKLGSTSAFPSTTDVTMAYSSSNGGVLDLNGFNQTIASLTNGVGGGSIKNTGSSDATLTINGSTSTSFGLVIADGTTNKTALTKAGTSTLTLSGANTYTGGTTITGGTLALGTTNVLADAGAITLNGGTFSTGATTGFNETVGTLNLSANSTIALGTGVHSLSFAASNTVSWTAATTLTITGWSGSVNTSGTAGKIFVGANASGLTSTQLAQITFTGFTAGATILSTGEIVPLCTLPTVTFTSAPTTACTGNSIVYTTQASQTNYVWSFSGVASTDYTIVSGGTTSSNTVTITWLTAGAKTVSVNYTNTAGCSAVSATVANTTSTLTVTPSITIAANPGLSICSGTSVTFTPTPTNGGTPSYQWFLNNVPVATSTTYSSSAFANGDLVKVTLTASGSCLSSTTATSGVSTINVTGSVTPTISISPATSATTCINTNLAFTSSTSNAGSSLPDWYVGGVLAQSSSATFTLNKSVATFYAVVAKLSSNAGGCIVSTEQSSSTTTVTVTAPTTIPTISISPSSSTICSGNSVNFTSTIANGGTQNANWYVDGNLVSSNSATYNLATPSVGSHTVYASLISDAGGCVSSATQTSSTSTITVNANVAPSVSIAASATSVCTGTAVTFTATPTNGGTSPVYAWYKNTVIVSGQTGSTYTLSSPANNDAVYAILTPSAEICVSPATGTSNTVNISVATSLPTVTAIYATSAVIYSGQSVKVGARFTSPSANPTFQWYNGASAILGATDSIFTTTSLASGSNALTLKVTDANGCAATTASQAISVLAPTAFTAGNIVIERVGEQAIDYSSHAGKVFLDQYTTSGSLVSSVTMPYSIGCYPSASNFSLTTSGNATSEGFITLSSDGKYISVPGYNIPLGIVAVASTATATSTNNPATINYRSIGLVGADGKATVPLASDILTANNIRSVASDGTQFWANGASGFYYFTNSTDNSSKQYAGTNMRSLSIFNGTLYVTSASTPYIGLNTLGTIASLNDNGTASQQLVGAGGTNSTSPYAFVFSPTGDAVYFADDSKGIVKYTTTDGVNYNYAYNLTATTSRGIIGDFSGTYPKLYATTASNTRGNTLISVEDRGTLTLSTATQVTLATAPFTTTTANTTGNVVAGNLSSQGGSVFKGLSWAPAATQNGYTYVNTSFRGTAFNSAFGTASIGIAVTNSSNSFGFAGKFISSNVTVTPPIGYEISTSATFSTFYTNSSPLTISAASLSETSANSIYQIYVRFRPTASGTQNGNITITYGANTKNVAVTGNGLAPTTYYYVSGLLTVASSYTDNGLSTGTKATDLSQTNTTWYIQSGNIGTINANWTLGANSTISVGGGSSPFTLNVSAGKLTFGSGAGINVAGNGTLNWYDVTAPNLTSISTGSTINYAGTSISQTIATATYSNLTFSGSGTRVFNSATYTIDNNFTVATGISVTPNSSSIYFNGATQNVPGITYNNLTISSSSIATAAGNITTNGTLVIEQGTFSIPAAYSYTQLGTVVTIGTGSAGNPCVLSVNGTFSNGNTTGTTCASFTLNTGGSVVFGASTSVYNHKGNSGSIPKATWNAASNCNVTGITSTAIPSSSFSQTFGNFTWNCASQGLNITVNTSSFATSGAFNVAATNTFYVALDAAIATNYTNTFGSIDVSGGTLYTCLRSSTFAPTSTVTVSGNITVSATGILNLAGGTTSATYSSTNIATNLSVGGDIIVASTASFTASNTDATNGKYNHGKITFTKVGTQTYTNATSGARFDFAVNSGSTVKLGSSITQTYTSSTDYDGLTLNNGSVFDINGFTLTANNISGAGKLKGSAFSNLVINGNVANTLYFEGTTAGISNLVKNLTITNTNTTTLGNSLYVVGVLTPSNGTLASGTSNVTDAQGVTRQGYLTLKSTSITNSAIVGTVGGSITGKVTVERFIPKGYRGYRDLSAGVANAGNMFDNWQEGGVSTSGYGIFISGQVGSSKGFNSSTGIDFTKTIDSLNWNAYYSNANTNSYSTGKLQGTHWFYILDTKSLIIDPYQPYRVLVRGDRSFNMFDTLHIAGTNGNTNMVNATTIRTTGNLITGNVVYSKTGVSNTIFSSSTTKLNTSTNSAVSVVANPYVSAVDLSQVSVAGIDGSISNKLTKFYLVDPTFSSTGTYVTVLNGVSTPIQSKATSILQPGQSIIVKRDGTSTDPTITFTESAKVTNTTQTAVFGVNSINRMDFTLLRKLPTDSIYSLTDGAVAVFKAGYSNGYSSYEDAAKLNNANDNISILHGNVNLSIDGRALATATDSIVLKIASLSTKAYQLQVDGSSFTANGLTAYLYDAYLKTTTALTSGVSTIDFTVDNNTASYANRFGVVFKPTAPLSVKAIYASATLKNEIATINWNTQGEEKVATYTVEKSTDAKNFNKVGEVVVAKNSNTASYNATDKNIANGNTYYRIKATNLDGSVQYSNIAKLSTYNLELSTYNLYPNPLKGKTFTIQMNNVAAGKYTVIIYDALGQKVVNQVIVHEGGIANHTINTGTQLSAGVYTVSILGSEGKVSETKLSVQ